VRADKHDFWKKEIDLFFAGALYNGRRIGNAGEMSRSAQPFAALLRGFAGGFGHEIAQVSRPTGRGHDVRVLFFPVFCT
jgi:hypothetical protein